MEIELQYLYRSTDAMMVPAELAGFALAESLSFEIVDDSRERFTGLFPVPMAIQIQT